MRYVRVKRVDIPLHGAVDIPGDKSISHRRAILSLLCEDPVDLENFGPGKDCQATLDCLVRLGKQVEKAGNAVTICEEMNAHKAELNAANSGTTARLLMGLLSSLPGRWLIYGDESLSQRPMERVAAPLREMGAEIELTDGKLPAHIIGKKLRAIHYELPVPSAQVKTAIMFAALHAEGTTEIREPIVTRDHTERILGLSPIRDGEANLWRLDLTTITISEDMLSGQIPGDVSSGTFWLVAAGLIPESQIKLKNIGMNPTRTAILTLLQKTGLQIVTEDIRDSGGEPVGDLTATHTSPLHGFSLAGKETAAVIDEIPALAVLATQCHGETVVSDAGELRVKESDRLAAIVQNLREMSVQINETENGFTLSGPQNLSGATINPVGDHRIAMAFALAGLIAEGETTILQPECADVSYPQFWNELVRLTGEGVF